MVMMDPSCWDTDEVRRALAPDSEARSTDGASGAASRAMVVGSTGPFASLAGRKALQAGGSAVDAVISTALTQIALAAGSWVSYAGVFCLVHHSAAGQTDSLSAGFATFLGEDDPAGIPAAPQPSGRTALVPGFMAGVQAAHDRFGVLPWADVFRPAVHIAEHGFVVGAVRAKQFEVRANVLPPSFRPGRGDVFCQPELAQTLRSVATEGAAWMYRGPWAHRFVDTVQAAGGKATIEDLSGYQPVWSEPVQASFAGHEVRAVGSPDRGGAWLLDALRRVDGLGDPLSDPRALAELISISRDDAALGGHSDFVVAVDEAGNVAALCHTINTSLWGNTGLFVDGISIPDSASFQQALLAEVGPGQHLPFLANPAVALRDGRPVLASSSIGAGLHPVTLQCLHAVLGLGVPVDEAVRRPLFHELDNLAGDSVNSLITQNADAGPPAQVIEDGFGPEILRSTQELGVRLAIRPTKDWTIPRGYWGGISLGDGLVGGRTAFTNGAVEGY